MNQVRLINASGVAVHLEEAVCRMKTTVRDSNCEVECWPGARLSHRSSCGWLAMLSGCLLCHAAAAAQAPVILALDPDPVMASPAPQNFTIVGSNFAEHCLVTLRSEDMIFSNRLVMFRGTNRLTLRPNFTTNLVEWTVEVTNPNGHSSGERRFRVVLDHIAPTISFVSPDPVAGSGKPQPFSVFGQRLVPGYSIRLWPGGTPAGPVYFAIQPPGGTQAVIHPVISTAGTGFVDVVNTRGMASGRISFQVRSAPLAVHSNPRGKVYSSSGLWILQITLLGVIISGLVYLHFCHWPRRLQTERENLIKEWQQNLHDGLKGDLDRISMASQVAQWMAADFPQLRQKLQEIAASAQSAGKWISTLISWRNQQKVELSELIEHVESTAAQILQTTGIKFRLQAEHRPVECQLDRSACDQLAQILSEALQNIWKHSQATEVDVRMTWVNSALESRSQSRFRLIISDNGVGLPKEADSPLGLGLISMRQRAGKLGGCLEIPKQTAPGTKLIVDIPWPPCIQPRTQ